MYRRVSDGQPVRFGDVSVNFGDDFVATDEWHRDHNNFFDMAMIRALADVLEALDADPRCRAAVLCSEGKHFCAGANLAGGRDLSEPTESKGDAGHLYDEAVRLFSNKTPLLAAVQGGAIAGALGLAMVPVFRFSGPAAPSPANLPPPHFHPRF